jgi:iron-sulfur cluster repair protein YtfE (RIC family)
METATQPLRDEHHELLPSIERIRRVADAVGLVPAEVLRMRIAEIHVFLNEELLPHARAEDASLYPAVGRIMGSRRGRRTG